jgi:hypothetical protein
MANANLIALVKSVAHVMNLAGKVLEDGKITLADISPALGFIVTELPALAEINFKELPAAIAELTPEAMAEVKEVLVAEFDIPQDKLEGTIEMIAGVLVTLAGAYLVWKSAQSA